MYISVSFLLIYIYIYVYIYVYLDMLTYIYVYVYYLARRSSGGRRGPSTLRCTGTAPRRRTPRVRSTHSAGRPDTPTRTWRPTGPGRRCTAPAPCTTPRLRVQGLGFRV